MAKWDENQFEVSLGRLRSPSGSRRAVGFFEQVSRGARANRRESSSGRSSRSTGRPMAFYRQVVIKASIKKMTGHGYQSLRKHLDYIERDGTDERGERAKAYGRGVEDSDFEGEGEGQTKSISRFAERCKDDRHHFRFVVSPEDSLRLQDLTEFTQDLVQQMEIDLETKLDWVGANHYDTGQPHTHLVIRGVRDNGKDLVIPKKYISQTMRQRAQDLVEIELGPVTQIEGRVRLAHQVNSERYTGVDKSISDALENNEIDLSQPVPKGRIWYRQLQAKRLQTLDRMGLAEKLGSGQWRLEPDFAQTLRDMGERNDIVKAIHRSLKEDGVRVGLVTERNRFDPNDRTAKPITGSVKQFGRHDDTREGGYIIIQSLNGEHIHAKIAEDETFETLRKDQVVTFQPHQQGPRKIDRSIADFANSNDGIYSEVHHVTGGGNVSPAYAQAHVRRLEALRRKNLVSRNQDGTWRIPQDYLQRASEYETQRAERMPTAIARSSTQTLTQMERARGVTWLDARLSDTGLEGVGKTNIQQALANRKVILQKMGFKFSQDGQLPVRSLDKLKAMDMNDAAEKLSEKYKKPYAALGKNRSVEGVYREAIERPSGKFAVIERSKEFTLVPWRPVMERRLGRSISGRVSAGGISWDVAKQRGLSR